MLYVTYSLNQKVVKYRNFVFQFKVNMPETGATVGTEMNFLPKGSAVCKEFWFNLIDCIFRDRMFQDEQRYCTLWYCFCFYFYFSGTNWASKWVTLWDWPHMVVTCYSLLRDGSFLFSSLSLSQKCMWP